MLRVTLTTLTRFTVPCKAELGFRNGQEFGGKLWSRTFDNQRVQAAIKCAVLNQMTKLGMPHTLRVC